MYIVLEGEIYNVELLQMKLDIKNKLVHRYVNDGESSFFHYSFQKQEDIVHRYQELMDRIFPRKEIAEHIRKFMGKFSVTKEIENNLNKLGKENSVVVIGGQQAGLLTGPLYSIHKMISIILLAKKQEQLLNQPVVPIFWVAGEDHDIQEVNHVYKLEKQALVKSKFRQKMRTDKQMVSRIKFDKVNLEDWYKDIIASFGETNYTNEILELLDECLEKSDTYTDFFISVANELFKKDGLLFIDSAHPELRKIERTYFQTLIEYGEQITEKLLLKQEELTKLGYQKMIDTSDTVCQLFLEENGERNLLRYDKENKLIVGSGKAFTKTELIQLAKENPEKFSNNVVTRPIMQEFLFPTIAFIAGPGEIAYWAELKTCFELLGLKIPPVFPRINITFLERNIESDINELNLQLKSILLHGTKQKKQEAIESLGNKELQLKIEAARKAIEDQYQEVADVIIRYDKGLNTIVKKNSHFVKGQLDFLERKIEESMKTKHDVTLSKYDRIERSLHPFGGLQERCWNLFYFLNLYGLNLPERLLQLPFDCNGDHYVVKL